MSGWQEVHNAELSDTLRGGEKSCALAVMIKSPRAGAVKTRLVPPLTSEEAAALSLCFLRDTLKNVASVARRTGARGVVMYTPEKDRPFFHELLPDDFYLLPQRGSSLGERLLNATTDLLHRGFDAVCLIGADSPTLPPATLVAAINLLALSGDQRVVLGPCEDGGYYLIGLKRQHSQLFIGIEWSTERVLSQTLARAEEIGVGVELLPAWYDVDDARALRRLRDELFAKTERGELRSDKSFAAYEAAHAREYLALLFEREDRL
ncbi:MAG TPA: TIGR04282 family arsenosugar biosynthesis glycosyltransferase [Pyrinomonadaceae bacterium]|nr:TIGR04282 family arsenosugar biosynthesis glycosyltransferase [Pyrinomonadaceae bacterium]